MKKKPSNKPGGDFSLWETSLRLIRRRYPGLAEQLEAGEPAPAPEGGEEGWNGDEADMKTETAAAGAPVLVIRGLHVHSNRDPVKEGRRLAENLEDGAGPLLILGFGLGYGAEAAAARYPGRPLIIAERHVSVLKKALETRNLAPFLDANRLVFVLGGTGGGIKAALGLFEDFAGDGKPGIIKNRALMSLNEGWYRDIERHIDTWNSRQDVNAATLRRFGKRWVRNLSRNMEAIRDLPGISPLEGVLGPRNNNPEIPVFLAAAGPSLDYAGPILKEIRRRCLVVAVDTSLRFLLKRGTDPDFTLVVDPQYWNSRHLDRLPAPHTRLVAESAVYPPVLRHPCKAVFLCGSLFPLGRFIEDRVDPKGRLGAGGSVATTAWDFARLLGARQIWIAGLDLAYPEMKTHFRGAFFEDRAHGESNRRAPAETWSVRALRDGQPFWAPSGGLPGGQVLTDRRLSLYAAWFENRFRRFPEIRNYRLSPQGLAVRGLEDGSPEALLALPDRREEIDRRLDGVAAGMENGFYRAETARLRAEQYEKARQTLLEGLERVKTAAEQGARTAEEALKRTPPPPEQGKILAALDEALRIITESEVKEVAGFLFPPPDAEDEQPGGGDSFRAYLVSSVKFYRALAEAAEYNSTKLLGYNRVNA
ncbi:MAG: DUF115 domain-containing protein [Treponema sp.]|jgi:hypothetical protein|nr:DUF115 domain-containing protein [Treponema sp.]